MKKSGLADSPFFSKAPPRVVEPAPPQKTTIVESEEPTLEKAVYQSVDRPTDRPTDQPVDQSTDQSTEKSFTVDTLGPVVARPRSFYITQKLDRWLNEAVRHLQDKGLHKADRSVLVNALLHNPDLFTPGELDKLRERVLTHLTNRSVGRGESTE